MVTDPGGGAEKDRSFEGEGRTNSDKDLTRFYKLQETKVRA